MIKNIRYFICLMLLWPVLVQAQNFRVETITLGLDIVWGLDVIDPQTLIFTERDGDAGLIDIESGDVTYLKGLPEVLDEGQGGLLDVAVAPGYQPGGWIYFTYSKDVNGRGATTLARARLNGQSLQQWNDLIITQSASGTGRHYGSRITFDDEGYLYFGVGDRGHRPNGQDLSTHAGSVLRLHPDGRVPDDNPFVGQLNARAEIWSYGHRNPQGLVWDPVNKRLWEIEHGPRGGDEINLVQKGRNYGWPVISYGKEYWGPISVGEDTHREGMEQPIKYYVPSIAPGSLIVYQGNAFPQWKGALMSGALKLQHINIVKLNAQGRASSEQRILEEDNQRIRALTEGPDGYIYFSTDSGQVSVIKP